MSEGPTRLGAAIVPFQEEYRKWLADHPEYHRLVRMTNVLTAAQGALCQATAIHPECYINFLTEQRLLSWLVDHHPEVVEAIFPSFKQAIIDAGILPHMDWDRVETHAPYRWPEDFTPLRIDNDPE